MLLNAYNVILRMIKQANSVQVQFNSWTPLVAREPHVTIPDPRVSRSLIFRMGMWEFSVIMEIWHWRRRREQCQWKHLRKQTGCGKLQGSMREHTITVSFSCLKKLLWFNRGWRVWWWLKHGVNLKAYCLFYMFHALHIAGTLNICHHAWRKS